MESSSGSLFGKHRPHLTPPKNLTKKDFIKFAEVIKELRRFDLDAAQYAYNQFCYICARDNSNFRPQQFLEACGLGEDQLNCKEAISSKKVVRKYFDPEAVPVVASGRKRKLS